MGRSSLSSDGIWAGSVFVGLLASTRRSRADSVGRRSALSSGRVDTAKNRRSTRAARKPNEHRRSPLAPLAPHQPHPACDAARALERGGVGSGPRRVQEGARAEESDPACGVVQLGRGRVRDGRRSAYYQHDGRRLFGLRGARLDEVHVRFTFTLFTRNSLPESGRL